MVEPSTTSKQLRRLVDDWIEESEGWFVTEAIWRQFNVKTLEGKNTVWQRLREHRDAGRLKKRGLKWRRVQRELEDIDIFSEPKFVDLHFPFGLEQYVRMTEGGLMVISGGKDAGKTAVCLNIAYLNMSDWIVYYFDSESGATLLKERLLEIDPNLPNPLPFAVKHCARNFSDAIVPDALNIIDYLDLGSQFQTVGDEMLSIVEALGKGVAIVALQKPPPSRTKDGKLIVRDLGYGGLASIHRAQIALSLDKGKLKLFAAKSRANPKINPINKTWTFKLVEKGTRFVDIKENWKEASEEYEQDEIPF